MTSNLGASIMRENNNNVTKEVEVKVNQLVQKTFPPEFLNRLDQIIIFKPLDQKQLAEIVDIQIERVIDRLRKQQIELSYNFV